MIIMMDFVVVLVVLRMMWLEMVRIHAAEREHSGSERRGRPSDEHETGMNVHEPAWSNARARLDGGAEPRLD